MRKIRLFIVITFLFSLTFIPSKIYAQDIDTTPLNGNEFEEEITLFFKDNSIKIIDPSGKDYSDQIKLYFTPADTDSLMNYFSKYNLSIVRFTKLKIDEAQLFSVIVQPYTVSITSIHNVAHSKKLTLRYTYSGRLSFDTVNHKVTSYNQPTLTSFRTSLPSSLASDSTYAGLGPNATSLRLNINISFDYLHYNFGDSYTPYRYRELKTHYHYPLAN